MAERLQKVLARMGLASRREADRWVAEGRIRLNRQVAELGATCRTGDEVSIDGWHYRVEQPGRARVKIYAYHKPDGEISTLRDPEGRPTVFSSIPKLAEGRWVIVGRLDVNTQGLLLFTTDGALANHLMHPSTGICRRYACRVRGEATAAQLQQLLDGVTLEDGVARFESIDADSRESDSYNRWYQVTLNEGRNREVRRLWAAVDLEVSRLSRTAYGPFRLPRNLPRGKGRFLTESEVNNLCRDVGYRPHGELVLVAEKGRSASANKQRNARPTARKKKHR